MISLNNFFCQEAPYGFGPTIHKKSFCLTDTPDLLCFLKMYLLLYISNFSFREKDVVLASDD